ncbi:MAG: hypothetical protein ACI9HK_003951 [Pirellulaceae bacterium]|jgi:hypothetical protein
MGPNIAEESNHACQSVMPANGRITLQMQINRPSSGKSMAVESVF